VQVNVHQIFFVLSQVIPVTRILITAFEPYEHWQQNASWLTLCDLTRWYDGELELVTRRYPAQLARMAEMLCKDLQGDFPLAIHLGQAPEATAIELETVGVNRREDGGKIINDGPDGYRTSLPLQSCVDYLCEAGIPCKVSSSARTNLCNAAFYLSQHYSRIFGMRTQSVFVHLPLAPGQAAQEAEPPASMSTPMTSAAVAMIMQSLVGNDHRLTA